MPYPSLGFRLQLQAGPLPLPVGPTISRAVQSVQVVESPDGTTGFRIVLDDRGNGRGPGELLGLRVFAPLSRVILTVTVGATSQTLVNGVVTHRQLAPSLAPGEAAVVVMGEDRGVLMDLEERQAVYPGFSDDKIAAVVIGRHGLVPMVVPPRVVDTPLPVDRIPRQHETDLAYLRRLAARHHYVFAVTPGVTPTPAGTGYWGPAATAAPGPPVPLSVATGSAYDVAWMRFAEDVLAPTRFGVPSTRAQVPTVTVPPDPASPLSRAPIVARRLRLATGNAGLPTQVAVDRAKARADGSTDAAVVAEGELDVVQGRPLLRAFRLAGVRGAGLTFDGLYRVQQVTHRLDDTGYRQAFRLARPATGTTTPAVPGVLGLGV